MSKANRIREMQEEINSLKFQLTKANERISQYVNRDKPMIMDFSKKHSQAVRRRKKNEMH